MKNKLYNKSLVKGHIFSRQPIANGQQFLDQMTVKSGHNVNESDIRADVIPDIISLRERNDNFLITINNKREVGGPKGSMYKEIIKFIDNGQLIEIPNSNGESYQVIDENNHPISNFIDPSDKPITNTKLSDGYTIQLFSKDINSDQLTPIPINFGWTFNTLNGIIHFDPEFKPGSESWIDFGFGIPVIDGFIYIGKSTSDKLLKITEDLDSTRTTLEDSIGDTIAIQPFKFSTNQMEKVGEPYKKGHFFYQKMAFIIPGYCFEISSLDKNETFITEMTHLDNGNTEIFIDFLWSIDDDQPIIRFEDHIENDLISKVVIVGIYSFIAAAFVRSGGGKINMKETVDYINGIIEPIPITPDDLIEGGACNAMADNLINININLNQNED